jgi:hypothetical protein
MKLHMKKQDPHVDLAIELNKVDMDCVDSQIRYTIKKAVIGMDLRLLQRIAYECRCEELGLHADGWKLYLEEN